MMVTVEGKIAELIGISTLDISRATKHEFRPTFVLDNATLAFRFSYPIAWRDPRLSMLRRDLATISKLLDHADVPVTLEAITTALDTAGLDADSAINRDIRLRVRNLTAHVMEADVCRWIRAGKRSGYVWIDSDLSDEEWGERIDAPVLTMAVPRLRLVPPTGIAIVIENPATAER